MKSYLKQIASAILISTISGASVAAIDDGMVAHWSFEGDANDVSGNGHNGTPIGAVLTTDRFGTMNSAYSFDGNAYIDITDSSDFTLGSNPFTLSVWSRLDAFSTDAGYYLMGHDEGPGNTDKWIFFQGNTGISFATTPVGWIGLGAYDFQVGDWHHLAIRRENDLLTAFVDGSPIGSAVFSASIPDPAAALWIGDAEDEHSGRNFRGSIDDVRIYSRALSDTEIQSISGVPLPGGIWLFLSGIAGLTSLKKRRNVRS